MQRFTVTLEGGSLVGERREGDGTPLVLAHGFGGSRHDWQGVIDALPADLPLVAYDARGFGQSHGEPGVPFSHAEDLATLLDALEVPRANLCGLSMGGGTVLHVALDHPARVKRLILVSPLMLGWSWTRDWIERWKAIGRAARAGDMDDARALWWQHPLFASTRARAATAAQLKASIDTFAGRQWVQDDQRPELPESDRLGELETPTLLLTGDRDTPDFQLMAEIIAAMGQDVTHVHYADAGHLLNLEIPEAIAGKIAEFLST